MFELAGRGFGQGVMAYLNLLLNGSKRHSPETECNQEKAKEDSVCSAQVPRACFTFSSRGRNDEERAVSLPGLFSRFFSLS